MGKLPRITAAEIIKALEKTGKSILRDADLTIDNFIELLK